MQRIVTYIFLTLSLILNLILGLKLFKPSSVSNQSTVKVSRVVDGDTFLTSDNKYIRLSNVDAPEFPENCLSTEAKDKLSELVSNKSVILKDTSLDHFGRTLASVYLNEVFIDKIILQEGLGTLQSPLPELVIAESEAKSLKKGIWGSKCNPDTECNIKGNYRQSDNTKIYHLPDCYNYAKIEIDLNHSDRWFCSETEALKAGFKKSADCPGMK